MSERCSVVTVELLTEALKAVEAWPRVEARFTPQIGEALNDWWQTKNWWHRMRTGALDINVFAGVAPETWERREVDDRYATICPTEAWEELKADAGLVGPRSGESTIAPTPPSEPAPSPSLMPPASTPVTSPTSSVPDVGLRPIANASAVLSVVAGAAMVGAAIWIGRR